MPRFVITGANRGIGLEMARQLLARGDDVDATAREPASAAALQELGARIHTCDVRSDDSVRSFADALSAVDVLVNNAGVIGQRDGLERIDVADALATIDANALGAVRVTRALLPHLRRSEVRKVIHISSDLGSIAENASGGFFAYRMSKAALNMASRSMAIELRSERIVSVVVHPGWVQTDMGGAGAPTPVDESVGRMLALIDRLTLAESGGFFDSRGNALPW